MSHPDRVLEALTALAEDGTLAGERPHITQDLIHMSDHPLTLTKAPRSVRFTVAGDPIPKGRPRLSKSGHAYTPPRTEGYETEIGNEWLRAEDGRRPAPFVGDVAVTLLVREAKHPADLDNYLKVVLDALNHLAFEDDKQVMHIGATLVRNAAEPGIVVTIGEAE